MSQMMPPTQQGMMGVRPHRGTVVLVLGILGLVICVICGIIAWVMGSNDLREMDAGRMDQSGRGLTQAGKIIGMVSVILNIIGIGLWILMMILGFGLAAAGAAGGAGGGGGTP